MVNELKIIVGDSIYTTQVLLDDKPIEFIQKLTLHIGVNSVLPEIEITFPNLFQANIDPAYFKSSDSPAKLMELLEVLKGVPNVKTILKDLEFTDKSGTGNKDTV